MKTSIKINFLDLLLIITILLSTTGFILARAEISPLNKVIKGKEKVAIDVFIQDIYFNNKLFKIGDKANFTIRNSPHGNLEIVKVKEMPKLLLGYDRTGTYKALPDPTKTNFNDYIVTLTDNAFKTKDGYVVGKTKIKIGNNIDLEGFNYSVKGKIINIYPLNESKLSKN